MNIFGERFRDFTLVKARLPASNDYMKCKVLPVEQVVENVQHFLPDIQKSIKHAKKYCPNLKEHKLSKDDAAAISLYTMEMPKNVRIYRLLNRALRDNDRSKVRPWFAYLRLLYNAISKLPKLTKTTVWCGTDKDVTELFNDKNKNKKFTSRGIISGSTSPSVISSCLSNAPKKTVFIIECLTARSIAAYTRYPSKNEVIFMPGTRFEVIPCPAHVHNDKHTIYLKEIDKSKDDYYAEVDSDEDDLMESTVMKTSNMNSIAEKSKKSRSEHYEFADADKCDKLVCGGRPCAKCHKCRDWRFNSETDQSIWDWICKNEEWDIADWNLWRHERYKLFAKRETATCSCYFLGLYLNYERNDRRVRDYRHPCLCERH
ncbi:unnamed protein product [Adineta ricciae]|uniref:NAD(P)(+)--arginine ADP-ribosyltransferase n=1 Tax=Adineta ricciae TaxID=249248 RepID=A0A815THR0_ADIRI|nr:unnamed protein product [Adineta ricciae]CAF1502185.1 unnamed protein product [Adineta ricciae]